VPGVQVNLEGASNDHAMPVLRRALLAAAITVAVAGAGCSDATDDGDPAPTSTPSSTTTAPTAAAAAPFFHLGGEWALRERGESDGPTFAFPRFRSAWAARYSTPIKRLPDGRSATSSLGLFVVEASLDDVSAEAEAEAAAKGKPLQVLGTTGIQIELKDGRSAVLWPASQTQVGVLLGHLDPTPSAVVGLLRSVSRGEWLALQVRDEVETSPDRQPSYAPTPPEG